MQTQLVLALVALFIVLAQSWDIAVTAGDRIEFYTNGTKTDTVRFDSQNLTTLAYDEVHNMLLYVDKQTDNDAICGYNISSVEYKCYTERSGRNIQGLAFDPITKTLFFTDTMERSINWISLKSGAENNVKGNLLIKMADGIPTAIAVDSCRGYIYWINTNITTSTIDRARFNGSEREVFINASYNYDLHSLAVGQQTQKLYWVMPETSLRSHIYSADFSGKNQKSYIDYTFKLDDKTFTPSNTLTISKNSLFMVSWCSSCGPRSVWKFPKPTIQTGDYSPFFRVPTESLVGIVAKYKIIDQIQGVQDCKALTSLVPNEYVNNNSFKIAREYVEAFCDHGTKVIGQSVCKCTSGYTGKRCDVSVCENYCLHGNCSLNEDGLPKCSCNSGYYGERCEVNPCHGYCLNNATCSLSADGEPVCQCIDNYSGDRCETSDCLNYCLQGDCSLNEDGAPECRCNVGYSGDRCEVNTCHGYCLHHGTCSLNEEDEPSCECKEEYAGDRCEIPVCVNSGDCSQNQEGARCNAEKKSTPSIKYKTAEGNLTLADLFANWRKPITTIVVVEVASN